MVPGSGKDGETLPERVTEWKPKEGTGYKSLLIEAAKRHRESELSHLPILIVIDTITTFLAFEDQNTSADVAEAMSELSLLADTTGAAVLALHHARKPRDGQYRVTYLGSVQFKAQSDIFLVLQRQVKDKENRQRSLEMEKTRLLYKEPLPILFDDQKTYGIDPDPPKGKGERAKGEKEKDPEVPIRLVTASAPPTGDLDRKLIELYNRDPRPTQEEMRKELRIRKETVGTRIKRLKESGALPA